MAQRNFLIVACCALLTVGIGCGNSHDTPPGIDAGTLRIMLPDGAFADRGPMGEDSGIPRMGQVGSDCMSDPDCMGTNAMCVTIDILPGNYCTVPCMMDTDCPDGSVCVNLGGGTSLCMDSCDPGAMRRECRQGYGCSTSPQLPSPVCIIGCTDGGDCTSGACDPNGGDLGSGQCYDPMSHLGVACTTTDACPMGAVCLDEPSNGWPGGACISEGCDVASNTGCMGDAQCLTSGRTTICVDGCTATTDCRAGYSCEASMANPDRKYCAPACTTSAQCSGGRVCNPTLGTCGAPFNPGDIGRACRGSATVCAGGTCLREFSSGFPASYCVYPGCTVGAAHSDCPGDSVCVATTDGTNYCLDACAMDTDCRAGYACKPTVASDTSSPKACLPDCSVNSQCTSMGDVCNPGLGTCGRMLMVGAIGAACTGLATECTGGTCFTETGTGWPGGMCVLGGCRLSGTGPYEMCPMGTVCVDDSRGDPTLGVCSPLCTVGAAMSVCRSGYACTPAMAGATTGGCMPMCTADAQCGTGHHCAMDTGLCH